MSEHHIVNGVDLNEYVKKITLDIETTSGQIYRAIDGLSIAFSGMMEATAHATKKFSDLMDRLAPSGRGWERRAAQRFIREEVNRRRMEKLRGTVTLDL